MKLALLATVAAILCSASAFAQDCTPRHEFDTVEPGVLTVAVATYAPYAWVEGDGEPKGVDGEIIKEIAKLECLEVKAATVDFSAAIQYIISGKADVTVGDWYRTAKRAEVVNLSAPLYLDQMGVFSKDGVDAIEDFGDRTVGTTAGNFWVPDFKKLLGDKLKLYDTSLAAQKDLELGRIDILVDGYSMGPQSQKTGGLKGIQIKVIKPDERVPATLEAGQGTFPMSKENDAMLAAFDADIKHLHDTGRIAEILKDAGLDPSAAETGEPRLIE